MKFTATYSPDDNKLRLYASSRLDAETYAKAKALGFKWAPKQDLFFAPAWSPDREDFLIELAGEIEDEDKSLVDRAEERAERFEEYSEKREADAERAREGVAAIADNIPLGQPILVGHHSERRARKDAERIQSGMRKAVRMWETSKYWESRAAGALRHAKHKERPDVRARRIKAIEADRRKVERNKAENAKAARLWGHVLSPPPDAKKHNGEPATVRDIALYVANYSHLSRCFPLADFPRDPPASQYEGLMSLWSALDGNVISPEQAAKIALDALAPYPARADRWLTHYDNRLAYERAMIAEAGGTASDRTTPEVGGAVQCLWAPRGGWAYIVKVNKVTVTLRHQWSSGGRVFRHNEPLDKLGAVMSKAQVDAARAGGRLTEAENGVGFYLSSDAPPVLKQPEADKAVAEPFQAMKDALKTGVQVVAAPQLFPTPVQLADRMAEIADIRPGHRVLEPSAGTGRLIGSMGAAWHADGGELHAIEINAGLCSQLRRDFPLTKVHAGDFLEIGDDLGKFDRVIMNPPFANGTDVDHVRRAFDMLKPGGRLVAIMSAGVTFRGDRKTADFRRLIEERGGVIEELPADTFKASGTGVNTVLVTVDAPA